MVFDSFVMKAGYYTVPPSVGNKPIFQKPVIVEDLVIGREGYGEIYFPGKTCLEDISLDSVVHISTGSVEVYPNDHNKPPLGCGLNRIAIVTLHGVWPRKASPVSFRKYLESATKKMGAEFLEYLEEPGSWTFRVTHFSKYGLNDSDEESEAPGNVPNGKIIIPVPSQNVLTSKGPLSSQDLRVGLLGRPGPLEGEETVPKGLFLDSTYHDEDENMNELFDTPVHLVDDLSHFSKGSVLTPSHSLFNFAVNNERLFGLKASLFEDDYVEDEYMQDENDKPFIKIVPQQLSEHRRHEEDMITLPPIVDRSKDLPIIPSAMIDLSVTPRRRAATKLFSEVTPYSKSLVFEKHNRILDAGCFHGLSFRVGWAPQMLFFHKAPSESVISQELVPHNFGFMPFSESTKTVPMPHSSYISTLQCSIINASSLSSSLFCTTEYLVRNMEAQLEHKNFEIEDGVPFFTAQDGVELLNAHFLISEQQALESKSLWDVHTVWSLCTALWGHKGELEDESPDSYNYQLFRKHLFSEWLIETTSLVLKKELESSRSHLSAIFSFLAGNCIAEACSKALESNDLRLGLLLAQAGSFASVKTAVLRQLQNWHQFEVDQYVDENRIKVFALLAGQLVWKTQRGTVINCCESLDWKRALALHLWYHCLPTTSIEEALSAYEASFMGTGPFRQCASFPYPPYIESNPELLLLASQSDSPPLDMCYYLLKLYCDRSTPLGKMLVPLTYGASQLDYSLSWMVHQVLVSLGYHHLPNAQSQLIHLNFASQLETVGLWHWAIFVLLHVCDAAKRKALVNEVLLRHVRLKPTEEYSEIERFLKDKLHLPVTWLFAAKAVLARSLGNYREEAWCLMKSHQWAECHKIILEKIAPDCIIHEEFDYLKSFLVELSNPAISGTILGWQTGGEVYLDYIYVSEKIEQMMAAQDRAYEIEELQPKVISLSNRICNLQCLDARGRLCQSEMSKKTVTLFRALLTLRRDMKSGTIGASGNHLLASLLPKLPMPEDYALQEMRATVRSYMLEVTNTDRSFS